MGVLQQINGASMWVVMIPGVLSQLADLSLKSMEVSIPQHSYWKNNQNVSIVIKSWRLIVFIIIIIIIITISVCNT
jgi:cytochrome bd-type quinol oxidase subunit 1